MPKLFNNNEEYTISFSKDDQVVDIAAIRGADAESAKLVIGVTRDDEEYQEITFTPEEARSLHHHLKEQDVQDILGLA